MRKAHSHGGKLALAVDWELSWREGGTSVLLQLSSLHARGGLLTAEGLGPRRSILKVSVWKGQALLCKRLPNFFSHHMVKPRINVGLRSVNTGGA